LLCQLIFTLELKVLSSFVAINASMMHMQGGLSRQRLSNRFIVEMIAIALPPYASIVALRDLPRAAS
jgi:hypothetical protein